MQQRKPLKAKKPLVTKSQLKSSKKPKKQTVPTVTKAKKEAIKWFNRAVKYRDSDFIEGEWLFKCITCDKRVTFRDREGRFLRTAHAGHFMPCHKENTRFNELNVNGQCGSCNYNQGEQYRYSKELDLKYGDNTADSLVKLSKISKQWKAQELLELAADYKQQCLWYEKEGATYVGHTES